MTDNPSNSVPLPTSTNVSHVVVNRFSAGGGGGIGTTSRQRKIYASRRGEALQLQEQAPPTLTLVLDLSFTPTLNSREQRSLVLQTVSIYAAARRCRVPARVVIVSNEFAHDQNIANASICARVVPANSELPTGTGASAAIDKYASASISKSGHSDQSVLSTSTKQAPQTNDGGASTVSASQDTSATNTHSTPNNGGVVSILGDGNVVNGKRNCTRSSQPRKDEVFWTSLKQNRPDLWDPSVVQFTESLDKVIGGAAEHIEAAPKQIVYLSPDAPEPLTHVEANTK